MGHRVPPGLTPSASPQGKAGAGSPQTAPCSVPSPLLCSPSRSNNGCNEMLNQCTWGVQETILQFTHSCSSSKVPVNTEIPFSPLCHCQEYSQARLPAAGSTRNPTGGRRSLVEGRGAHSSRGRCYWCPARIPSKPQGP